MKLVDVDPIIKNLTGMKEILGYDAIEIDGIVKHLREVPEADAAPVVHSRFVNMGGFPACEHCGASPGAWEPKPDNPSGFPPYCFACGAKMDKEET